MPFHAHTVNAHQTESDRSSGGVLYEVWMGVRKEVGGTIKNRGIQQFLSLNLSSIFIYEMDYGFLGLFYFLSILFVTAKLKF